MHGFVAPHPGHGTRKAELEERIPEALQINPARHAPAMPRFFRNLQ